MMMNEPHTIKIDGSVMRYRDEGSGPVVLLVHGTPTWSFLYRSLIDHLSPNYRCIAPDHLGFGLSDKPIGAAYRPADHARRLRLLVDHLGLEDIVLVVHDFGGPIGLSLAIERPTMIRGLVLMNTWMWSLQDNGNVRAASRLFGSSFGKFLYTRLNFSPRFLMPLAMGKHAHLPPDVHAHYLAPFASPSDRYAPWVLARELIGSSAWYDELWRQRDGLRGIPALLFWGMRDPAFGAAALARWQELFPRADVVRLFDAGHFVQEEDPDRLNADVAQFLANLPDKPCQENPRPCCCSCYNSGSDSRPSLGRDQP